MQSLLCSVGHALLTEKEEKRCREGIPEEKEATVAAAKKTLGGSANGENKAPAAKAKKAKGSKGKEAQEVPAMVQQVGLQGAT